MYGHSFGLEIASSLAMPSYCWVPYWSCRRMSQVCRRCRRHWCSAHVALWLRRALSRFRRQFASLHCATEWQANCLRSRVSWCVRTRPLWEVREDRRPVSRCGTGSWYLEDAMVFSLSWNPWCACLIVVNVHICFIDLVTKKPVLFYHILMKPNFVRITMGSALRDVMVSKHPQ